MFSFVVLSQLYLVSSINHPLLCSVNSVILRKHLIFAHLCFFQTLIVFSTDGFVRFFFCLFVYHMFLCQSLCHVSGIVGITPPLPDRIT